VPQVDVTINSQSYRIACDEGQQEHIRGLAQQVDKRIGELVSVMGQIGELRLLVMASMLLADELDEARQTFASQERTESAMAADTSREQLAMAADIEALAERIEAVAARLEAA